MTNSDKSWKCYFLHFLDPNCNQLECEQFDSCQCPSTSSGPNSHSPTKASYTRCDACYHRQIMEFCHERSRPPSSTSISESTVSARVPQLIRWRWRHISHWFGHSVRSRAKPETADRRLLDTGWIKGFCRWSPQEQLGPLGCPTTAAGPGRPAVITTTAFATTIPRCDASVCKCKCFLVFWQLVLC